VKPVNNIGANEHTYIYVIYNPERNRSKIGKANDPKRRLINLQTGSCDDLELAFMVAIEKSKSSQVERLAHKIAVDHGKPKKREWFSRTTAEEAKGYVETAHELVRGRNT